MWPPIQTTASTPTTDYWNNYRRHVVYRLFDSAGELLYIGASSTICQRLYEHRRTQPWFPQVARMRMQVFPTRAAAFAAEKQAIRTEGSRYNKFRILEVAS